MQVFGHIDGVSEGQTFNTRLEVKEAGLHKHHIGGISRILGVGCDCIVLSGGYSDDIDNGDIIFYTGEGGRERNSRIQTFNQPFERGNLDLSKNKYSGDPIRVIRGSNLNSDYAPSDGYRYDGLYSLDDYWPVIGNNGFRVWRYKLIKIGDYLPPKNNQTTQRRRITTNSIIRNPAIPERLKEIYNYTCQICNIRLEVNGNPYAIGAHIKGLGSPHNGPDSQDNMIILCPNDHYLFDAFGFSINDDFTLIGKEGSLNLNTSHHINLDYIKYHRECYKISSM